MKTLLEPHSRKINRVKNSDRKYIAVIDMNFRQATEQDISAIVEMLADDELGNTDGRLFFESMIKEIQGKLV